MKFPIRRKFHFSPSDWNSVILPRTLCLPIGQLATSKTTHVAISLCNLSHRPLNLYDGCNPAQAPWRARWCWNHRHQHTASIRSYITAKLKETSMINLHPIASYIHSLHMLWRLPTEHMLGDQLQVLHRGGDTLHVALLCETLWLKNFRVWSAYLCPHQRKGLSYS